MFILHHITSLHHIFLPGYSVTIGNVFAKTPYCVTFFLLMYGRFPFKWCETLFGFAFGWVLVLS